MNVYTEIWCFHVNIDRFLFDKGEALENSAKIFYNIYRCGTSISAILASRKHGLLPGVIVLVLYRVHFSDLKILLAFRSMLSFLSPFLPLYPVFLVQWNEKIDLVVRNIAMIFCRCQISEGLLSCVVCMILWDRYRPVVCNPKPWVKR